MTRATNQPTEAERATLGASPQPSGLELERLVTLAREGGPSAEAELFERYVQLVGGLVRRLMPDYPDRDDVVQEVFVRALESLPRQRDPETFPVQLRALTVHVVRNRLRRRRLLSRLRLGRRQVPPDDDLGFELAPSAPPQVVAELRAIYRAVGRLEPDARLALVLRRVEGLTVSEVAAQLGCSVSAIERLLRRGEVQLKYELTPAVCSR